MLPILPVDCFFIPWIFHTDAMVSLLLLCLFPIGANRAYKIRSVALVMFCPCFNLDVESRQIDWRLRLKIFMSTVHSAHSLVRSCIFLLFRGLMFAIDEKIHLLIMFRSFALASSLSAAVCCIAPLAAEAKPAVMNETIQISEVQAAQQGWCDALLAISKAHAEGGIEKSKPLAGEVIDAAYGYQFGPVSFKPTWTKGDTTFRETRSGALSYFVGDDSAFADPGFAIGFPNSQRSPWVECTPEIVVIQSFGNTANAMGWVHFVAADGSKSMVDKTFGYVRDDDGSLRIILHHSSLPFSGF